jgi:opacity protein-like surface antigen
LYYKHLDDGEEMKKLLVAAAVAGLVGTANAQSAFEGFYGQIGTGYESNSLTDLGSTYSFITAGGVSGTGSNSASNQNANGMPLVIGLGYNFKLTNTWLLGVGADYSALSQETSNYRARDIDGSLNGPGKIKVSNRYNIFLTPGYAIDKNKLLYAKAGYSSQTLNYSSAAFDTTPALNKTSNANGYVLGVGYKQMITSGFYGFAEGNYMSYSKANMGMSWTETNGVRVTTTSNSGSSAYTLLVGVGYKF